MSDAWSAWHDDRDPPALRLIYIGRDAPAVADLARRCAALADRVADLETLLADERRAHAVTQCRPVVAPRRAGLRDAVLAFLVTRLEAANTRMKRWGL